MVALTHASVLWGMSLRLVMATPYHDLAETMAHDGARISVEPSTPKLRGTRRTRTHGTRTHGTRRTRSVPRRRTTL